MKTLRSLSERDFSVLLALPAGEEHQIMSNTHVMLPLVSYSQKSSLYSRYVVMYTRAFYSRCVVMYTRALTLEIFFFEFQVSPIDALPPIEVYVHPQTRARAHTHTCIYMQCTFSKVVSMVQLLPRISGTIFLVCKCAKALTFEILFFFRSRLSIPCRRLRYIYTFTHTHTQTHTHTHLHIHAVYILESSLYGATFTTNFWYNFPRL